MEPAGTALNQSLSGPQKTDGATRNAWKPANCVAAIRTQKGRMMRPFCHLSD